MIYLHNSVFQSHGYLYSGNCYVDNRWVLKVSGFALHVFRSDKQENEVHIYIYLLYIHDLFVVERKLPMIVYLYHLQSECIAISETVKVNTIRYDSVYLTCSKKLTDSQLTLLHGTNNKYKRKTKK